MKFIFSTKHAESSRYTTLVHIIDETGHQHTRRVDSNVQSCESVDVTGINGAVVAELMAIRHIFLHSGNLETYVRKPHQVVVSKGQVKKSLKGRVQNEIALTLLGAGIHMVFPTLDITVNNKSNEALKPSNPHFDTLQLSPLYISTHIDTTSVLGEIRITATAIEQFTKHAVQDLLEPFKALKESLSTAMKPMRLPERVWRQKCRKWKDQKAMEYWTSEDSPLVYVFKRNHNRRVLLTCYRKLDLAA